MNNNEDGGLILEDQLFKIEENEPKKVSKRCFLRMLIMLFAAFLFSILLFFLNCCSCLKSLNALWFNLVCSILLVGWAFYVYFKRNGVGVKI